MNRKVLVFDLDGTIVDLYGVKGWLEDLHNESVKPYVDADPLYDMSKLVSILERLRYQGWYVCVTSWLAKGSSKAYDQAVRKAKKEWLDMWGFPYDKLSIVKYGRTKADSTRKLGGFQILFDDNQKVRRGWNLGATFDANDNIIPYLENLLVA